MLIKSTQRHLAAVSGDCHHGPRPVDCASDSWRKSLLLILPTSLCIFYLKKKRIWETLNLSTDADRSTDTTLFLLFLALNFFFEGVKTFFFLVNFCFNAVKKIIWGGGNFFFFFYRSNFFFFFSFQFFFFEQGPIYLFFSQAELFFGDRKEKKRLGGVRNIFWGGSKNFFFFFYCSFYLAPIYSVPYNCP